MQIITAPEAELEHPVFIALARLWLQAVRDGNLPSRALFFQKFPEAIKANSLLARIDRKTMDVHYSLAGAALERLYGEPMQGCSLKDLYSPWIRKTVKQSYEDVLIKRCPLYQRRTFSLLLGKVGYERLILPLEDSEGYAWAVTIVFPTSKDIVQAQDWQRLVAETPWLSGESA